MLNASLSKLQDANRAPAADADCVFDLKAAGKALECLYLRCQDAGGVRTEAEIAADFDALELFVDGVSKWRLTPAQLIYLREFDGSSWLDRMDDTSGVLQIPLVPSYLVSQELASALRLGTEDVGSCKLVVECSAGTGCTVLGLWADAAERNEPIGWIRTFTVLPRAQANTGWEEIDDLPRTKNRKLARYHVNTGAIPGVLHITEGLQYFQNGAQKCSFIPGVNTCACLRAGRTLLATYHALDLMRRGLLQDAVPWAGDASLGHPDEIKSHKLRINWSTAPTGYHIIEESFEYVVGVLAAQAAASK